MDNLVVFKGTLDGLAVMLNSEAPFEEVLRDFEIKLQKNKAFFKGASVNLSFKGRDVSQEEQDQLMSLLTEQNILGVSFVHSFEKKRPQVTDIDTVGTSIVKDKCKFYYGIVRSGQHIHADNGTLIVLGDVNPGGLVSADENIIIWGSLRGNARSGLQMGVDFNFVAALDMQPRQLGIKNILTCSPDNSKSSLKVRNHPQIAYTQDEQIIVDELVPANLNNIIKNLEDRK